MHNFHSRLVQLFQRATQDSAETAPQRAFQTISFRDGWLWRHRNSRVSCATFYHCSLRNDSIGWATSCLNNSIVSHLLVTPPLDWTISMLITMDVSKLFFLIMVAIWWGLLAANCWMQCSGCVMVAWVCGCGAAFLKRGWPCGCCGVPLAIATAFFKNIFKGVVLVCEGCVVP